MRTQTLPLASVSREWAASNEQPAKRNHFSPLKSWSLALALGGIVAYTGTASVQAAEKVSLPVLIVGGGPEPNMNQVAIESNVRYIERLLPKRNTTTVLFADGNKKSATVLYASETPQVKQPSSQEEGILDALLIKLDNQGQVSGDTQAPPATKPAPQKTAHQHNQPQGELKAPKIKKIDGATTKENIENAFTSLSTIKSSEQPLFLYFTGHGSSNKDNLDNNHFDLWKGGKFTVQDLSYQLSRLPAQEPVALVMVQCFSGSFGNVLFEGGDPKAPLIDRELVGFFAATKDRVAAGCTPAVNEEYYRDFTSYFFAALTGTDRLNRKAAPDADFNHDGKVGMDEAFYWSIINDQSIDVPVATSDVFLERFSPLQDDSWEKTPYSTLMQWASPAQKAALEGLSTALELKGEDRTAQAKQFDIAARIQALNKSQAENGQKFIAIWQRHRTEFLTAYPDLTSQDAVAKATARKAALKQLSAELKTQKWQDFLEVLQKTSAVVTSAENLNVQAAKQLRYMRLVQKIVRDHALRTGQDTAMQQRYFKLLKSEGRTLLPYQS